MVDYGDNRFVTLLYGDDHFVTLLYGDTRFATLLYGDSWFLYCTMYLTDHLAPPVLQVPLLSLSPHPFFPPHQLSPLLSPLSPSISCSPFDVIPSHRPLYAQERRQWLSSIASDVTRLAAQRLPHQSWSRSSAPPSIDLRHDIIAVRPRLALLCSYPSPLPLVSSTCDTLPFPSSLCSRPSSNPFHQILAPLQNAMNHSPHPPLASTHGPV
ncbi:hypothetical protein F5148DRAFT_1175907 [Russula earlei]|uniref:Uncharacterized protein n=1 Tax=Russula earlei TaxID=71964 RepID=A0ACC0UH67_9AGAM|nr:hypothetical protein F5148DRAFT_1175907 [Russula earlei]